MTNNYNSLNPFHLERMKLISRKKIAMLLFFVFFGVLNSQAQVTTNSGSGLNATYADLASAITALNGATISSPVVITLDPANPQTAPAGGYAITAQGDATNTILIQGSGNTITASGALVAGVLNDAIFKLVGADYVTLQNFTMQENAANTTSALATNNMTEWGVALLYTTTTNGAQNNTIQNNTISLNRTYANTFGIYSNSTHAAATPTTGATATTVAGGNHGLKIYTNAISNVNNGIVVVGPTAAADQNTGLDIGGASLATANTITNYGTTGTFSAYANVATLFANGILVRNSNGTNVSYNTVTSSVGGVTAGTLTGIHVAAASNTPTGTFTNNINNNSISLQSGLIAGVMNGIIYPSGSATATSTLNINNNDFNNFGHTVAGTATIIFITTNGTDFVKNINNNTFTNISVNTIGSVTFISHGASMIVNATHTISNNAIVTAFAKTGAGGTVTGLTSGTSSVNASNAIMTNNNFSNITVTGATSIVGITNSDGSGSSPNRTVTGNIFNNWTGGTSSITGMSFSYIGATSNISNNTLTNISGQGAITGITIPNSFAGGNPLNVANNTITNLTSSGAGGSVVAITCSSTSPIVNISGNAINTLSSTGASSVSGITVSGASATGTNVFKNKIYDLSGSNASSTVNGLLISGGALVTAYNNIIGDLRTPSANLANPLNGINITGGTTVNAYYNSVYLNGSSVGALFGSSAISAATGTTVNLRNNIFVNNSTVAGAGLAVAYRRSSTTLTSYAAASNNNLFYASNIYTDGTNTDATILAFKTRMATRDAASISENPNFVSILGANVNFLHINPAIATQIEGTATTIATFTDDFDGDVRNVSTPDIGADEFIGIPISVVVINDAVINPVGNLCTAVSRTVTSNITAGSNDITSVTLNYSFNGVAQTPIAMTGGTLTGGTTSTFTAVIPVAVPVNANVTWSVSAVDPLTSKSASGTTYQDEPLFGSTGTANATITSLCSGGSTVLSAVLTKNGFIDVGAGALTTTGSGGSGTNYVSPFTHWWGGYKAQYIIRSSELAALGFTAGTNLTSLGFDVTSAGTTYNGFTLAIGTTPATVLTTTYDTSSLTQVYTGNLAVSTTGSLTLPFGTGAGSSASFVWDGTSNVLINLCWSNNNGGGTPAEVKYDTTSFVAMAYYRVDNATPAVLCSVATATATLSNRPKMIFGGTNLPIPTSSISWSDGSTVVGTGNNLSVSPTVNTTYTATLTALGCTINTSPVAITVNTTPAPTGAVNQTFSNGQTLNDILITGTSIIWYASASDAATATNALPSSTLLVDDATYYATQTIAGCASTTSLAVTVDVPLGMNTFDSNGFRAHPNPVNNTLNIEYTSDLTNVTVYNMLGQQVLTKNVTASSTQVDMSGLNAGTYLVKVEANDVSKTLKVVKQ